MSAYSKLPDLLSRLSAYPARWLNALATPHNIEGYIQLINPVWSASRCLAQIDEVRQEAPDCVSLVLRPNSIWQGHTPGQYVSLTAEINGRRLTRCFSISDANKSKGTITLTIKAHADGIVSRWAVDKAWQGEVVELGRATGSFVLPDDTRTPLLFIAGGSGITPIMAMIRHALLNDWQSSIRLLYYTPIRDQAIFRNMLQDMSDKYPQFQVELAITRDTPKASELHGHFHSRHVIETAPDLNEREVFVCGPDALINDAYHFFVQHDREERCHSESFKAPRFLAPSEDGVVPETTVSLQKSSMEIANSSSATLLERLEAEGLQPESGCRIGICHTCTCTKKSGRVRDMVTGAISGDGEESIRLCVSQAITNIELDI